ncbi:MAG TPA: LytR C-terminal domain-containing protein [Acidimicrobiales bacterium]|nr:LytR C-terminal domain-containing protein [Acidimicrobiales bacterium]
MGRRWVPLVVVFVGALLGVAVAGLPNRRQDARLALRTTVPSTAAETTVRVATSTTSAAASTRPPGRLKVLTVNASGAAGAAARLAARLAADGYDVGEPASRPVQETSTVLHRPGFDAEAGVLAASLGLAPATLEATGSPPAEADLVVVIGRDLGPRL